MPDFFHCELLGRQFRSHLPTSRPFNCPASELGRLSVERRPGSHMGRQKCDQEAGAALLNFVRMHPALPDS